MFQIPAPDRHILVSLIWELVPEFVQFLFIFFLTIQHLPQLLPQENDN